jgi:hypothetical protein
MPSTAARIAIIIVALACAAGAAAPARAAELCGRPGGSATEVFARLSKVEKLPEVFRDGSYVALRDAPNMITWTFTVPGHAAHPSVVCRRIVRDADGRLSLDTEITCDAPEPACLRLKRDFDAMNARMIEEMNRPKR